MRLTPRGRTTTATNCFTNGDAADTNKRKRSDRFSEIRERIFLSLFVFFFYPSKTTNDFITFRACLIRTGARDCLLSFTPRRRPKTLRGNPIVSYEKIIKYLSFTFASRVRTDRRAINDATFSVPPFVTIIGPRTTTR